MKKYEPWFSTMSRKKDRWDKRKTHGSQMNGHSPWSRDEGESIEEWGEGRDSLEEVHVTRDFIWIWGEVKGSFS